MVLSSASLANFGPTFVGVIQIPATATDEEILKLNAAGVRAVRFNLYRGGSAGIEDLDHVSLAVYQATHITVGRAIAIDNNIAILEVVTIAEDDRVAQAVHGKSGIEAFAKPDGVAVNDDDVILVS